MPPRPLGSLSPAEIVEEHAIWEDADNRKRLRTGTTLRYASAEAKDWLKHVDELSVDPGQKKVVRTLSASEIEERFMK